MFFNSIYCVHYILLCGLLFTALLDWAVITKSTFHIMTLMMYPPIFYHNLTYFFGLDELVNVKSSRE